MRKLKAHHKYFYQINDNWVCSIRDDKCGGPYHDSLSAYILALLNVRRLFDGIEIT